MTLAETIQAKILTGELPNKKFVRTWYGRGESHPCSACALPVTTNQIEVEGDLVEDTRGLPISPRLFRYLAGRD